MLKLKEKFLQLLKLLRKAWSKVAVHGERFWRLLTKHRTVATVVGCLLILSMLMSVITVSVHRVDVLENGVKIDSFYAVLTDDETLMDKSGIVLSEGDELEIIRDGGVVTVAVDRAFPVSIEADGQTVAVMLASGTVADAMEKAGITANEGDLLSHATDTALEPGLAIKLDRVTGEQIVVTKSIDYETEKIETDSLYEGQTKVKQKGEKGEKELTYSVTYINGEETDRELISEVVTKEPVKKIVLVGTKVKSNFLKTSSTPKNYKKVIAMTATAYSAGGLTASGIPAEWGVVAVDPRVIPLGTKVYVETADGSYIYGTAIAADTGGAIKGNKIDICVNTRSEAYAFGRRTVNVYIL